jgi:hypothetical protein
MKIEIPEIDSGRSYFVVAMLRSFIQDIYRTCTEYFKPL